MIDRVVLEGPRLTLRPVSVDDVEPGYVRWMNDPDVTRHLESRHTEHTVDDLRRYITAMENDPTSHFFAMVVRDESRHIGNVKLGPIDAHHRRGDLGILIGDRTSWGKGFATEAIELMCRFAFDDLRLHKVTAGAYGSNPASVRAFVRAGFAIEGRRPEQYLSEDGWVDGVLLGRLAGA